MLLAFELQCLLALYQVVDRELDALDELPVQAQGKAALLPRCIQGLHIRGLRNRGDDGNRREARNQALRVLERLGLQRTNG